MRLTAPMLVARLAFTAAMALPATLTATPVTGTINAVGGLTWSNSLLSFTPTSSTGLLAGLVGTGATMQPFSGPAGANVIPNFITFDAAPTLRLNVTSAVAGPFSAAQCGAPPAAGQACTLPSSPFGLVNTASGAMLSVTLQAEIQQGTAPATAGSLVYTMQFANQSYQQVLATLIGGGAIDTTYSAQFTSAAGSTGFEGGVTVTNTGLSFSKQGTANKTTVGWQPSSFDFGIDSSTGTFAGLAGTTGILIDLVSNPPPIANFLTLGALPAVAGDFIAFDPGAFSSALCGSAPASGQTCSLLSSPFNLVNLSNGSGGLNAAMSFGFDLTMRSAFGELTPYTALFTTQFAGSYQQVLASLVAGGSVVGAYSASYVPLAGGGTSTAVPEPASLVLLGSGVVAAAFRRRRSGSRL